MARRSSLASLCVAALLLLSSARASADGVAYPSSQPPVSISVGFDHARYDELAHAKRVAEHLGCEFHPMTVTPDIVSLLTVNPGEPLHALATGTVVPTGRGNENVHVLSAEAEANTWHRPPVAVLPASPSSAVVESVFADFAVGVWADLVLN